jgi:hypothetical protein
MKRTTPEAADMTTKQHRFAEKLKSLLDAGCGTESVHLFCRGAALGVYKDDASLRTWLRENIGQEATRQLITLFAVSPCPFCRRGLEPCADCEAHGHFEYTEICESCLGLGVRRCDFCNGSGLNSIDAVPRGLRAPVGVERAGAAMHRIKAMTGRLATDPAEINPRDSLKEQTALILRLTGLVGTLVNELGESGKIPIWTPKSPESVTRLVNEWPCVCRDAEKRICTAFQSMSATAQRMADDAVEGSNARSLALARAEYFGRFTTPEELDRTDIDHPILNRIAEECGASEPAADA